VAVDQGAGESDADVTGGGGQQGVHGTADGVVGPTRSMRVAISDSRPTGTHTFEIGGEKTINVVLGVSTRRGALAESVVQERLGCDGGIGLKRSLELAPNVEPDASRYC
jgi:hypothetical protein